MERTIFSLAFKGPVPEAIAEALSQKKLFVVYISGDNEESARLNTTTWMDPNVADSISKYCVLLHLSEGSTDATQFSAIYPQKATPCITAIGYNGVQLWQNDGFISAEFLASSLEKMWLSLHVQEATATFLALASKKSELTGSGASQTVSLEAGSTSLPDALSSSPDNHVNSSEGSTDADLGTKEIRVGEHPIEETNPGLDDGPSNAVTFPLDLENDEVIDTAYLIDTTRDVVHPVKIDSDKSELVHAASSVEGCSSSEKTLIVGNEHPGVSAEALSFIGDEASEVAKPKMTESSRVEKDDSLDVSASRTNDVHLNIKLPNGVSLQKKFLLTSTLQMVKDFVDEKQESNLGSYDIAIPYPRKTFGDQDLCRTLSELGLLSRQALIVVPHRLAVGNNRGPFLPNQSTSTSAATSTDGDTEGYLSYMKRILSYINPLSYLGGATGSATSAQESQSRMWQHGDNSAAPQSNPAGSRRSHLLSPTASATPNSTNSSRSRQQNSSGFGSNIHTLRHDEEDINFRGRNSFWNGNSTQYGGEGEDK